MKHNGYSKSWRKIQETLRLNHVPRPARRLIVGIVGLIVLLAGTAMIVLPGPALLFIPLGLAILATEFEWARAIFRKARNWFKRSRGQARPK